MHLKMQCKTELGRISSLEIPFLFALIRKLWSIKTVRLKGNAKPLQVYTKIIRHVLGIPPEKTFRFNI